MTENLSPKKSVLQRFWWLLLFIFIGLLTTWGMMTFIIHPKETDASPAPNNDWQTQQEMTASPKDTSKNQQGNGQDSNKEKYPACPLNLAGILTAPLIEPQYIGAMLPLGNVSPPGHTFPVDHIYFLLNTSDKIPLYAPADGWITHIMANSAKKTAESDYVFDSYVVTYTICNGLVLDFAGYTEVIQPIQTELAKYPEACKSGITKVGHDNAGEQQCDYQNLNIKVTANQLIGYTHRELRADGGGYNIPFEIWATNYNQPARSDVDWSYYDDNRYAHALCTFDLYSGSLKEQFDDKFGSWSDGTKGNSGKMTLGQGVFTPRTAQPLCGEIVQNIAGTVQGAWFSSKPAKNDKSGNIGDAGYGISIIHNNVDPTIGEVVIGGEFENKLTGVIAFTPTHSGTINREPSEVKADGQVYCYSNNANAINAGWSVTGKILIRLIDDHHIEADHQAGTCGTAETIQKSYSFTR